MNSKSEELAPEAEAGKTGTNAENEAAVESVASPMDPMAQLEADLKAAKAEVSEWQDRFLRKAADLENYRKRAEKEKADLVTLAKSSVLIDFLPLADGCERALKNFGASKRKTTDKELEEIREKVGRKK